MDKKYFKDKNASTIDINDLIGAKREKYDIQHFIFIATYFMVKSRLGVKRSRFRASKRRWVAHKFFV